LTYDSLANLKKSAAADKDGVRAAAATKLPTGKRVARAGGAEW
jgi:hypothetical protein